jgi:hypothetical protein
VFGGVLQGKSFAFLSVVSKRGFKFEIIFGEPAFRPYNDRTLAHKLRGRMRKRVHFYPGLRFASLHSPGAIGSADFQLIFDPFRVDHQLTAKPLLIYRDRQLRYAKQGQHEQTRVN